MDNCPVVILADRYYFQQGLALALGLSDEGQWRPCTTVSAQWGYI